MFPENRNFPNRQRKPVKGTEEMQDTFQRGSVLPFAVLVVIAVVVLTAVVITAFSGWMTEDPEPTEPVVTTAPTQAPTETTAPVLAPGEINWTLYGIWITPFGRTGTETELSVSGKVTLGEDGEDIMELSIIFPDEFDYAYTNPTTYTSQSRKYTKLPYCVSMVFSYAKWQNDIFFSYFALCPEKEYMIFRWDETPDRYLVASTNPDADPQEILEYFQGFIEYYIKK